MLPPNGFKWQFIAGLWSLVPLVTPVSSAHLASVSPILEVPDSQVAPAGTVVDGPSREHPLEDSASGGDLPEIDSGTDDSESEFDKTIRLMLPGLCSGPSEDQQPLPPGARRSERQKKPSSRWNEDAGFVPEPPRSVKKKCTRDELREGTASKPLCLNDWTDAQLLSYCSSCGIDFIDSSSHKIDCIRHIRLLEKNKSTPSRGVAETS